MRNAQGQTAFREQSTNMRQQAASSCGLDQPDLGERAPLPVRHEERILAVPVLHRIQRIVRNGQVAIRERSTDPRQVEIDRLLSHRCRRVDERTPFLLTGEVTTGLVRQFARALLSDAADRTAQRYPTETSPLACVPST